MTFERFTTSSGAIWPVEEAGDGPPVVALHGVGGGAYFFRGVIERLRPRYRVLATDLPVGIRADGSVEPASMETWAAGLSEVLAARVSGPAVIVGHSLGTILALELWRLRPDLVRALVFVGGLPEVRDVMRARLRDRLNTVAKDGLAGWGPVISAGVFGREAFTTVPEVVGMFERLLEAHPLATYLRNMEALLAASATDVVPTVTVPCLSISGTEDLYAPPDVVSAFLRRLPAPCEQVLMDGVGHLPFFEAPDQFARTVDMFLSQLPAGQTR